MRKFYFPLLLLFIICCAVSCEADSSDEPENDPDIVNIPDAHFKRMLLNTNCVDTNFDRVGDRHIDVNNDGEVQYSEVELVEGLVIDFFNQEIDRSVDLTGIENFVNLRYLKLEGFSVFTIDQTPKTELITYDFTALNKLEYLELNVLTTNHYESLDLGGLSNLKELKLTRHRPYYVGYTEENLKLPANFLKVNLEGTNSLTKLDISNSFLNIDFCQIPSLKELKMSYLNGGEPEIFDFHCLTSLEWLDISENLIKTLILKNSSVLHTLIAEDIGYGDEGFANYPYLEQICIDDNQEEFEQIASLKDENTVVVTDCSF